MLWEAFSTNISIAILKLTDAVRHNLACGLACCPQRRMQVCVKYVERGLKGFGPFQCNTHLFTSFTPDPFASILPAHCAPLQLSPYPLSLLFKSVPAPTFPPSLYPTPSLVNLLLIHFISPVPLFTEGCLY